MEIYFILEDESKKTVLASFERQDKNDFKVGDIITLSFTRTSGDYFYNEIMEHINTTPKQNLVADIKIISERTFFNYSKSIYPKIVIQYICELINTKNIDVDNK